jgi:hypothetical protein
MMMKIKRKRIPQFKSKNRARDVFCPSEIVFLLAWTFFFYFLFHTRLKSENDGRERERSRKEREERNNLYFLRHTHTHIPFHRRTNEMYKKMRGPARRMNVGFPRKTSFFSATIDSHFE